MEPHIGGGVGWARNTSHVKFSHVGSNTGPPEDREDTADDLTWWIGLGLTYKWSERWRLELAYRYSDLGKIKSGPFENGTVIEADEYVSQDIIIGLQFGF